MADDFFKTLDEKNFGKFLADHKLGEKWSPNQYDDWETYKRIAVVSDSAEKVESSGLQEGYERHWYSTGHPNLWFCEVRMQKDQEVVSQYFHFYKW